MHSSNVTYLFLSSVFCFYLLIGYGHGYVGTGVGTEHSQWVYYYPVGSPPCRAMFAVEHAIGANLRSSGPVQLYTIEQWFSCPNNGSAGLKWRQTYGSGG